VKRRAAQSTALGFRVRIATEIFVQRFAQTRAKRNRVEWSRTVLTKRLHECDQLEPPLI
jgi:hypothetical protein